MQDKGIDFLFQGHGQAALAEPERVAGLKVSKSVFVEMFSTETGGNGSSPPAVPRRCCNAVCKKPGPGAVPSALPSGQYLASQG